MRLETHALLSSGGPVQDLLEGQRTPALLNILAGAGFSAQPEGNASWQAPPAVDAQAFTALLPGKMRVADGVMAGSLLQVGTIPAAEAQDERTLPSWRARAAQ